jgi:hypothetical protein
MKYQKVSSTDLFDPANYGQLMDRLEQIGPEAESRWGKMNVAQMLHHLNIAIGSGLGYYDLPDASNWLTRNLAQFVVLKVWKGFPKGIMTAPGFEVKGNHDFEQEKQQLKEILARAYETQSDADWGGHPLFGQMSRKAWGELIVIHCNHHFQQFGQ